MPLKLQTECRQAQTSSLEGALRMRWRVADRPGIIAASVLEPKFGDKYSGRGARIARREEGVYWA
jgi:hypothetical protein